MGKNENKNRSKNKLCWQRSLETKVKQRQLGERKKRNKTNCQRQTMHEGRDNKKSKANKLNKQRRLKHQTNTNIIQTKQTKTNTHGQKWHAELKKENVIWYLYYKRVEKQGKSLEEPFTVIMVRPLSSHNNDRMGYYLRTKQPRYRKYSSTFAYG